MANHASHGTLPYIIKGARFSILIPYLDADGDPTDPTTPDTEFSLDDGAAADTAEEVSAYRNSVALLTLTGAETNGSLLSLAAKAASGPKATLFTFRIPTLAVIGSGTLSAGSAGGGTLGTLIRHDITGCFIKTTGGTGGGGTGGLSNQARRIVTYNVLTGAFTVGVNWETTVSTDTTYEILLPENAVRWLSTTAQENLQLGATGMQIVVVGASSTTTNITTSNLTEATDDHYNGAVLIFLTGALANQRKDVTDYNGTTKALTVTALTEAPASGDLAILV